MVNYYDDYTFTIFVYVPKKISKYPWNLGKSTDITAKIRWYGIILVTLDGILFFKYPWNLGKLTDITAKIASY